MCVPVRCRPRRGGAAWLWLVALAITHCTWDPVARPVKPELVLAGMMRVDRPLDPEARRILVEERLAEGTRWHLVDTEALTTCVLPPGRPVPRTMKAPSLKGQGVPKILFPLLRARKDQPGELFLVDETCAQRGPYGEVTADPDIITLRSDGREVALVLSGETLRLLDPWTEKTQPLAEQVGGWAVAMKPQGRVPDALWLLEGQRLTQRALDGTLLVATGEEVTEFAQTLSSTQNVLRLAYTDGGAVYEALSPDYTPTRIANDACSPRYVGDALDVSTPCAAEQLVRIENGQVRFFPEGVHAIYPQGDITLQRASGPDGSDEFWVARSSGARVKLEPTPYSPISVLDAEHLAARTNDGRFGIWSFQRGFQPALSGVRDILAYRSPRESQYVWLLFDQLENKVGRLSTFSERAMRRALDTGTPLEPELLASHVPEGGFTAYGTPIRDQPIILSYDEGRVQEQDPRIMGTLHARLLNGSLGSLIDENVTSSRLVLAPLPGVLYTIGEGARVGLWFAAL